MPSRNSSVGRDRIEYSLRLIFDDKGNVRMTRQAGQLERNEREVAMTVTLPTTLFKTPQLQVSLTVPDGANSVPPIDLEATYDAIRGAVGIDVDIKLKEV